MAASRTTSMRILRAVLADTKPSVPTRRALHITGTRYAPSFTPTGAREAAAGFNRRNLTDLKEECRRRTISSSGTKHELIDRLINHDSLQSRAFSIAMKKIVKEQRGPFGVPSPAEQTPSRHFNTTRSLKANNDTSTIDFAYLPDVDEGAEVVQTIRMPILPDAFDTPSPASQQMVHDEVKTTEVVGSVMKPEVYSYSDPDGTHDPETKVSTLQEAVDNNALEIDPYNLTETVTRAAKQLGHQVENEAAASTSVLKKVWMGFVDDVLGEKKKIAH